MSELGDIQQRLGSVQQDVGRALGMMEQVVEGGRSRDANLRRLEQRIEEAEQRYSERLDRIEGKIEEMTGPVADYMTLRQRGGYIVGAGVVITSVVMFIFGPAIPDAVRRAVAWLIRGSTP